MALFTQKGFLPASDLLKYMDALAGVLKLSASALGLNAPNESGTAAAKAAAARLAILGDESTAGIRSAAIKANVKDSLDALVYDLKWDTRFARYRTLCQELNNMVSGNLPDTWSFASTALEPPFDLWLQRINGTASPVAGSPTAGTLTAANDANGRMPGALTSQRPYIVHTLGGASDWQESLPSGNATQVDITGANNAYSYQIASTVPAGVYKVRLYRGYYGDASNGTKYYIGEVAVTPGGAYPAILLTLADSELRVDVNPPSWLSCLPTAEFAALFALGFGTAPALDGLLQYAVQGVLSPRNVALIPANGLLGLRNVPQSAEFGRVSVTGAATMAAYAAGTIQTANNVSGSTQGFGGALGTGSGGIRARVLTPVTSAGTITISYGYYEAANGWGSVQTQTGVAATLGGTAAGSTAVFAVPAGRIVVSVTVTAVSGMGGSGGTFLMESESPRTI